jgi:hypothetical protein
LEVIMGQKLDSAARAIRDNAYDEDGPLPALRSGMTSMMEENAGARRKTKAADDFLKGAPPAITKHPDPQEPDAAALRGVSDYSSGSMSATKRREREAGLD